MCCILVTYSSAVGTVIGAVTISMGIRSLHPYATSWGVIPIQLCGMALIIIATKGNVATQPSIVVWIHSTCSMVRFITLAIPSIYRWYAVENYKAVLCAFISSYQNFAMNHWSRSVVIVSGSPCWLMMWRKKASATASTSVLRNGTSMTILLKWSMTVMIV